MYYQTFFYNYRKHSSKDNLFLWSSKTKRMLLGHNLSQVESTLIPTTSTTSIPIPPTSTVKYLKISEIIGNELFL